MQIVFHRNFRKAYAQLVSEQRRAVDTAIERFRKDPRDPVLHNHALRGVMRGQRAISAGFDLRIIFSIEGVYVTVIMLAVGGHERVYK